MQNFKNAEELAKEFGVNLATARKKKGYTQKELAQKIGKENGQTISNWESGNYPPKSFADAIKLSDVLDVDLDYLTGRLHEPTHDIQFIHDQTGLTGDAVRKLQENRGLSFVLSLLIEQEDFIPLLYKINQKLLEDSADYEAEKDVRDLTAFQISRYLIHILEDIPKEETYLHRIKNGQ